MYSGERVSPVPWSPPVYVSATVTKSPETLRKPSSCTPRPTTTGSVIPNNESRERGIVMNSTPIAAARPRPTVAAACTPCSARSGRRAPRFWPATVAAARSEEHTSELQSLAYLVWRLLLEKKKIDTLLVGGDVSRS